MIPRGTPIAVCAPCGAYDPVKFEAGLQIARARGHDLRPLPGNLRPHRYLAADDELRLAQLVEALTDPTYGAVWIARGGFGLTRILDRLPFDRLAARPVIGFSDVTALFSALYERDLGPCIHAPVVHSLASTDPSSLACLFDLLDGLAPPTWQGEAWVEGRAEGPLIGGNLCLLAATCGTRFQLDARGAILALEDVGEPAYRLDRMLQQLVSAGVFEGVAGVALGEFVDCRVPDGADWTLADVLRDHLVPLGVPVLAGLPFGHGARNHAFTWGERVRLQASRLERGSAQS